HPPTWLEDTQPAHPSSLSPDDVETAELPGELGEPTIAMDRVPTGATPTARLPRPVPPPQRPGYVPPHPSFPPEGESKGKVPRDWGKLLIRISFIIVATAVLIFFLAVGVSVVGYVAIASQLPPREELRIRQTAFVSSKIYDREGQLLYEVTDPEGGRRTYVLLGEISQHLINATIATEDRDFWVHPGFDPIAILRAVYYNVSERRIVSGASTITQQLARNILLTPEERVQQTIRRKIKEAVLAAELTRTYSKEEILEIYLNEAYYGNLAYGIQAAAETYFGVDAADLTLAQASFLAGLPQSPATYDPFGGGLDLALSRQEDVLELMVEDEYITNTDAALAAAETSSYEFKAPRLDLTTAPHFVVYVRQTVEAMFGPEALYRGTGLRIYTTLDPRLQSLAEGIVRDGVAALADRNGTNGALVALDPATGHVRAMVGSADFHDEAIDGQVNVALRCRQPGSSIKPFTYVAAFERGWTLSTLLWDTRTEFPDGANPPYVPVNYDEKYHGSMLLRDALANSYNVPAVEALQFVGVSGLLEISERLGVESLVHPETHCPDYPYDQPPHYGLALTLGGGEAKLLEMTGAFATFANGGARIPPNPILRIEDSRGNVLVDNSAPIGEQVISAQHAYLITSILADTQARCRAFHCPSILELGRPAAAKTGTTNDFRDALTIGYTPDLVTGVWVGNSDNSSMINLPGTAGAGPLWHDFMEAAHADLPVRDFVPPPGITEYEICADSGAQPTRYCTRRKREVFAQDQPPPDETQDWYQMVKVDAFTGLLANEFCSGNVVEQLMLVITDERGREWVQTHPDYFGGLPLAPLETCVESTGHPRVFITHPGAGSAVHGIVPVVGTVQLPNFERYEVQYGLGGNPQGWGWISGPHLAQVRDGSLAEWDTSHLSPGLYTLRITAFGGERGRVEARVQVYVAAPTESPTPTLVSSPTSEATPTPSPTFPPTPFPTLTPTFVPTVEPTVEPTITPTVEPTVTPTIEPTVEITATLSITVEIVTPTPTFTPAP
ncbi:MAG: PBP1A family penicillin-binding protein, partial [Chloroflexota bacterium]|nr:PBP1A family penicillin-binding protein [Chloroflexota bacterium]